MRLNEIFPYFVPVDPKPLRCRPKPFPRTLPDLHARNLPPFPIHTYCISRRLITRRSHDQGIDIYTIAMAEAASVNGYSDGYQASSSSAGKDSGVAIDKAELESAWEAVHGHGSSDFTAWENLVRVAEGLDPSPSKKSSDFVKSTVRKVYDQFLQAFPLCFGYWKKYADIELLLTGPDQCKNL